MFFFFQCEATNEEELFEVQDSCSLFTLGWIHVSSILLGHFLLFAQVNNVDVLYVFIPSKEKKKRLYGICTILDIGK
jgi:hypothetical protein